MEDPQEDHPGGALLPCVWRGCAVGGILGVGGSGERDLLSVLSICPPILLCVFIVCRRIVRILCLLLCSAICWCVCWLLWFGCQCLPGDWL